MADKVTAADAQGALSEGDNSNRAFPTPTRVGDAAFIDITPPSGKEHPGYVIPGVPHAQLALGTIGQDQYAGAYGLEGADLTVGPFAAPARIWIKWASTVSPAPKLALPPDGFTAVAGSPTVGGGAGSPTGSSGTANEVGQAAGGAGSGTGASGTADKYTPTPTVGGGAGSGTGSSGTANEVGQAAGGAGSGTGASGTAIAQNPAATGLTLYVGYPGSLPLDLRATPQATVPAGACPWFAPDLGIQAASTFGWKLEIQNAGGTVLRTIGSGTASKGTKTAIDTPTPQTATLSGTCAAGTFAATDVLVLSISDGAGAWYPSKVALGAGRTTLTAGAFEIRVCYTWCDIYWLDEFTEDEGWNPTSKWGIGGTTAQATRVIIPLGA
jgi:hypothetical protein